MSERNRNWDIFKWYQWIRLIGIILAVYVTMEYVLPVVFPFCIGFVIAFFLHPLCCRIERKLHVRRELACFLALLAGMLLALLFVCGVGYVVFVCGSYADRCGLPEQLVAQGRMMWNVCCDRLHGMTGRWVMQPEDYSVLIGTMQERSFRLDPVRMMDNWKTVSVQTLRVLAYALVTIVSALLMLSEFEGLKQQVKKATRRLFHVGFGLTLRRVGRTYIKAQLIIIGTIMAICVGGLFVARERYFLMIGVAIGICDALPFLGTGICFLPWALWRFLTGRYVSGIWFVVLYMITSFVRQSQEPKLIGQKIGVPPLAVLISIYIGVKVFSRGGFLLGPISAFLIWQLYSGEAAEEDAYENDKAADGANDTV